MGWPREEPRDLLPDPDPARLDPRPRAALALVEVILVVRLVRVPLVLALLDQEVRPQAGLRVQVQVIPAPVVQPLVVPQVRDLVVVLVVMVVMVAA